ncbi:MAG: XRE family transcriptional regulator [Devosia sp.]|nr:XRE family transcriptional regulator [Devosia sp.]
MSTEPADLPASAEPKLGHELRQRRLDLGLTLKQVADDAGLSVGFISQLERGLTAPSLSSLVSICKVLKTDVGTYLQQPRAGQRLSRHGQRPQYSLAGLNLDQPGNPIRYERVSTQFPGRKLHSVIMNVPPGYRSETISHDGEEMIFVLSGELTSFIDGRHAILQPGDAEHFPSTLPHSVWNHTSAPAQMLWVGTQEVFGHESAVETPLDQPKPPE